MTTSLGHNWKNTSIKIKQTNKTENTHLLCQLQVKNQWLQNNPLGHLQLLDWFEQKRLEGLSLASRFGMFCTVCTGTAWFKSISLLIYRPLCMKNKSQQTQWVPRGFQIYFPVILLFFTGVLWRKKQVQKKQNFSPNK